MSDESKAPKIQIDLYPAAYTTTDAFRAVTRCAAVCDENENLIAVTGPEGDALSNAYAIVFSLAPAMLELIRDAEPVLRQMSERGGRIDKNGKYVLGDIARRAREILEKIGE